MLVITDTISLWYWEAGVRQGWYPILTIHQVYLSRAFKPEELRGHMLEVTWLKKILSLSSLGPIVHLEESKVLTTTSSSFSTSFFLTLSLSPAPLPPSPPPLQASSPSHFLLLFLLLFFTNPIFLLVLLLILLHPFIHLLYVLLFKHSLCFLFLSSSYSFLPLLFPPLSNPWSPCLVI